MKKERSIQSLPRWAQEHIAILEQRVKYAEATIPWTEPGMEWYMALGPVTPPPKPEEEFDSHRKLFMLSPSGAQLVVTVGPRDRLFLGRAKPLVSLKKK